MGKLFLIEYFIYQHNEKLYINMLYLHGQCGVYVHIILCSILNGSFVL